MHLGVRYSFPSEFNDQIKHKVGPLGSGLRFHVEIEFVTQFERRLQIEFFFSLFLLIVSENEFSYQRLVNNKYEENLIYLCRIFVKNVSFFKLLGNEVKKQYKNRFSGKL